MQPGTADGVQLGVDKRWELLESRAVSRFGLRELGELPPGGGKLRRGVDGRPGQIPEGAQLFDLGLAEDPARTPRRDAKHPDHRALRTHRHSECGADRVLGAIPPQPAGPGRIVVYGQRRADPPHLARQALPPSGVTAQAGHKASGPAPDHQTLKTVLALLDEIEQCVRGPDKASGRGHDLLEQVSEPWLLGGLRRGCSCLTRRPEPGVGPRGRHVSSSSLNAAAAPSGGLCSKPLKSAQVS
jgi:hypothetical protein